jgi:hypothetical protein
MDPISNADRIVRLIRQRLEERTKAAITNKSQQAASVQAREHSASAIAGELARAGAQDEQLRRSLVEQLLADQFGPVLVNDARFQQIVDLVARAMTADPAVGRLMAATIKGLSISPASSNPR